MEDGEENEEGEVVKKQRKMKTEAVIDKEIAEIDEMSSLTTRLMEKFMQIDSNMVKLADQARINRREFVDAYKGRELDPTWLEEMGEKSGRGWQMFIERSSDKVEELRADMAQVGQYVGLCSVGHACATLAAVPILTHISCTR